MTTTMIPDVLETWRSAEQLLDELPPLDPDHETVRLTVVALRDLYQRLTDPIDSTTVALDGSRTTIDSARALIRATRKRHRVR